MEDEKKPTDTEVAPDTDTVPTEDTAPAADTAAEPETSEGEKGKKESKKSDKKLRAELAALTEEKARLEAALAEEQDKYLRLAAEYDNFRRRSAKEKDAVWGDAVASAVSEILPLLDNLERAGQFTEGEKVAEGLAMMAKMSDSMLAKLGVERFGAVGDTFDANLHNAVMHVDDEAYGESEIVAVFQVGYRRGDKVIRFAMVQVAN